MRRRLHPLIAVAVVFAWQFATVYRNYNGNWTALFCTGAHRAIPPALHGENVYQFRGSTGYDGQFYHFMAHDPFMVQGSQRYMDEPRLRFRRILMPALAWLLAAGQPHWIDAAYIVLCLAFIWLGVFWAGPWFLVLPAVLVSIDRMTVDVALAALAAGFILYAPRPPSWKLWVILAAAALVRETGLLLVLGYFLYQLSRKSWKPAALAALSAVPTLAWYAYVHAHTAGYSYHVSLIPFSAIFNALVHPLPYPSGTPLVRFVQLADQFALVGILLAFLFAIMLVRRDPLRLPAFLFVLTGVLLQRPDHWFNVYDYGRVYTPLLLLVGATGPERVAWLPVVLMLPRVAIQFVPQILGLFGHGRPG